MLIDFVTLRSIEFLFVQKKIKDERFDKKLLSFDTGFVCLKAENAHFASSMRFITTAPLIKNAKP